MSDDSQVKKVKVGFFVPYRKKEMHKKKGELRPVQVLTPEASKFLESQLEWRENSPPDWIDTRKELLEAIDIPSFGGGGSDYE